MMQMHSFSRSAAPDSFIGGLFFLIFGSVLFHFPIDIKSVAITYATTFSLCIIFSRLPSTGQRVMYWIFVSLALCSPIAILALGNFLTQTSNEAKSYYHHRQYQQALDKYSAIKSDAHSWLDCGDCYLQLGQDQKAIENYARAAELQAEQVKITLADKANNPSDYKQASDSLAATYYRLAKAYERNEEKALSQKSYQTAKKLGYKPTSWTSDIQHEISTCEPIQKKN